MNTSARPSVLSRHCDVTNTLVGGLRQPSSRFGFPAGMGGAIRDFSGISGPPAVALSTKSGKAPKAVTHPDTGFRRPGFGYEYMRAAAEAHSGGSVSPITRAAAGASASAPPTGFTFTPVLRGYESTVVGRCGLRGREPHIEPRHGHGACPRAAKARPADAVPPLLIPQLAALIPARRRGRSVWPAVFSSTINRKHR